MLFDPNSIVDGSNCTWFLPECSSSILYGCHGVGVGDSVCSNDPIGSAKILGCATVSIINPLGQVFNLSCFLNFQFLRHFPAIQFKKFRKVRTRKTLCESTKINVDFGPHHDHARDRETPNPLLTRSIEFLASQNLPNCVDTR